MSDFLHAHWLPLLGNIAFKSSFLLLLGWGLSYFFRHRPALRHRLGVLTFISLLLLPVLLSVMPSWTIEVPVLSRAFLHPTSGAMAEADRGLALSQNLPSSALALPATQTSNSQGAIPAPGTQGALVWNSGFSSFLTECGPSALFIAWSLGAAFIFLRTLVGLYALRGFQTRGSELLTSGPLAEQNLQLARELNLRRPVVLRIAPDEAVAMPMTWGWRRPTVLLPASALRWSHNRLQSVFLHELSHIQRGDWLAQCLSCVVCAMYWCHPLVWMAATHLKADAERATDEQVVAIGVRPSEYCNHLLELARFTSGANATTQHASYAVSIAYRSGVEDRLNALLEAKPNRDGDTRIPPLAILLTSALVFLLVGTMQFQLRAQSPVQQNEASGQNATLAQANAPKVATSFTTSLSGGGSATLLGISGLGVHHKLWWTPQGDPLSTNAFTVTGVSLGAETTHKVREFVVALQGLRKGANWRWETDPGTTWGRGDVRSKNEAPNGKSGQLIGLTASVPQGLSRLSLKLGIAQDPWKTMDENDARYNASSGFKNYSWAFTKGFEERKRAIVTVTHTISDQDVRVVAVDVAGVEHPPVSSNVQGTGILSQVNASFDLPLSRVRAFRMQNRPFHWMVFPNVPL